MHSRLALPGAGTHPAKLVVQNLIGLVKPGGWIQQTEMVFTEWPNLGPAMKEMVRVCVDVFTIAIGGQELDYLKGLEKWYAEAGLEDVQYETYTIGIGKRAGSEKIRKISVQSFESTCRGLVETAKGEFFQCLGLMVGLWKRDRAMADRDGRTVMPPISVSLERLETLPERVREELIEIGGTWQVFTIWGWKKQ